MALKTANRVKETSTTTGTSALTLAGAMTGFSSFGSRMSVGDTCYYTIQAVDGNGNPTGDWECGLGTYSATNTLTRTTIKQSSNSDAAVSFAAGTKQVWVDIEAADYVSTKLLASMYTQAIVGTAATLGPSNPLIITGLDTANYDYKVSVRLARPSSGAVASDYLTMQFGDATLPTPTWDTAGLFLAASGAVPSNLTTSAGVTRVAQVQNTGALNMGSVVDVSFANGSAYTLSAFIKSYMWENSVVLDGTLNARAGALKFLTVNQNWSAEYTVWALKRT